MKQRRLSEWPLHGSEEHRFKDDGLFSIIGEHHMYLIQRRRRNGFYLSDDVIHGSTKLRILFFDYGSKAPRYTFADADEFGKNRVGDKFSGEG